MINLFDLLFSLSPVFAESSFIIDIDHLDVADPLYINISLSDFAEKHFLSNYVVKSISFDQHSFSGIDIYVKKID